LGRQSAAHYIGSQDDGNYCTNGDYCVSPSHHMEGLVIMDVPDVFDVCYIDCDLVKYRSSFSVEKTYYHLYDEEGSFVDEYSNAKTANEYLRELSEFFMIDTSGYYKVPDKRIGEEQQAKDACDLILKSIKEDCPAKVYKLYLTGDDSYRHSVATIHKYKGDRADTKNPKWIDSVEQHIVNVHGAEFVDYIECDDYMTTGLWDCYRKGLVGVAANLDKDVHQAPLWHYNWVKRSFKYVTPEEGLLWCYTQACAGDMSVDNYEGIPRIGVVKAGKILEGCNSEREMYEASVEAYRKHFGDVHEYVTWYGKTIEKTAEELFLENMKLAYMLKTEGEYYKVPEEDKE